MQQARKEAAWQPRRIVYNDDAGAAWEASPEAFINARLRQTVNTQVDLVTFDPRWLDDVCLYPTKVAEVVHGNALIQAGYDPVQLALQYCHEHNIEFFPTIRMNDIHDALPGLVEQRATWKKEHPDYLLGTHEDWDKYPQSSPHKWWVSKDYAISAVRDRQFLQIQELCENYDIDGIELDWFRSPQFFRPTLDLQPTTPEQNAMMNDFMRRIRKMTERVSRQRGRPLLVAVRIPMSVQRSLSIGLDIVTWLRDDLCDIVTVGGGYVPMAMAPQVREMAEFVHQYDRPLYACISASGMREELNSVEAWRGAAMNIWYAGADAVYTFNFFPAEPDERLSQMGSPETLRGLDKIYAIDYIVVEDFEGDLRPGLVAPDRLPRQVQAGTWTELHLPVGENVAANAPAGKSAVTQLRIRCEQLPESAEIIAQLNGQDLGAGLRSEVSGNANWLSWQPNPSEVRLGENIIKLTNAAPASGSLTVDRLHLVVHYQ